MNIGIISYGNVNTDGRLNELIESLKLIGLRECDVICMSNDQKLDNYHSISIKGEYLSARNYLSFFTRSFFAVVKRKYDILLIDNFWAAPIGLIAKKISKKTMLIQDCRECYEVKRLNSAFGRYLVAREIRLMKKANVVIEANEERAYYVKEKYQLKTQPWVFENIRFLPTENNKETICTNVMMDENCFNVISTGGVSIERGTLKLINSFANLPSFFRLYIVGGGSENDIAQAKKLIDDLSLIDRVYILGKVDLMQLYSLVSNCQVGVVHYHQKDINNILCASGKIYEYIGCGIPVVTSGNKSLTNLCQKYHIGESGEDFAKSLLKVYQDYDNFCQNVGRFRTSTSPEANRIMLAEGLKKIYTQKKK